MLEALPVGKVSFKVTGQARKSPCPGLPGGTVFEPFMGFVNLHYNLVFFTDSTATHCELLLFHLLGEHIDYCGYGVLPMAVEQDIVIAVGQNDKKMLNLSNTFNSFQ